MSARFLHVLVLFLQLLLWSVPAAARNQTYCVGGFEFDVGLATRQKCKDHENIHPRWHFHTHVRGPDGLCRECWDELDATCETKFLNDHPDFATIDEYDCMRRGALPPTGEELRVENGEVIKSKTPPPAPQLDVRAEIVRISAGPYATGDKITVDAAVRGPDGKPRSVRGGEVVVKGADGSEKLRVPVRPTDSGATAELSIPAGGNLSLSFVPAGVALLANEKLGKVAADSTVLSVNPCRLRGAVLLPRDGDIAVFGTLVTLRGQLRDKSGAAASRQALGEGTRAVFVLEMQSGKSQEIDAQVDAAGVATASIKLDGPASGSDSETVAIRLLGRGGGSDFCPDAPVRLALSRLGVALEILQPPPDASCYVGRPCRVAARFRLPQEGPQRALAAAFIQDFGLQLGATLNGEPVATLEAQRADDGSSIYAAKFIPRLARLSELAVTAQAAEKTVQARLRIRIRQPLELRLEDALDFGQVAAGSARAKTCQTLDFSSSSGVEEQEFGLQAQLAPACRSTLHVVDGHGRYFELSEERRITLGLNRTLRICLDVPRCAGESPNFASLTVQAKSSDFPTERAVLKVRFQVISRSFLSCHLWWIASVGGALFLLFVVYGFIRPFHFGPDDTVKIANQQSGLQRASARRLRDLPGGRAGFYRSAATGLREDGSATRSKRQALIVLEAARGGIVLFCRGQLQCYNSRTRKLEDIPVGKQGYCVSKSTTYRVAGLYFQVHG